ncbi:M15 family metallopeptidase [Pseudoduganella chitinolytica]|uniref:M15 family metallopeptidase n=1 Tax=Pseudoduganella chitinolytica TaxID=34070 RepID=A0ABY8BCC7_9BURK|nr:M15 family metallopeptidase [Pseudoduganella chitinolytica]WEF33560.1 M15 family metallopeptidase [Pseudoduganella chitinolytica]
MILFSLLLLFVATCVGGWLALFPDGRDALGDSLARCARHLRQRLQHARRQGNGRAVVALAAVHATATRARAHPLLAGAVLLLVLLPPLGSLLLAGRQVLPQVAERNRAVNEQVAGLLRGERLVAPPAPPPAVFTTAEVTLVRPQLAGANRNWDLLDQEFAHRLLTVFHVMREQHGYEMVLLEGYRSPTRQNELADAGGHVTNARAFQSYHQFGLAGDCAFLRDGKLVISERDAWAMRGYQLYGEAAEAAGLTWGGRWKMMDFGHTELRGRRR